MFERFTDRARRVVVLAQEEARLMDHAAIGTEHVLLGLIHEGTGVASTALDRLGVRLDAARVAVLDRVGRGPGSPGGHVPFTPKAKKVLELSLRESLNLGHRYIGTEHILLGLLTEPDATGFQVLDGFGVDAASVRSEVLALVSGGEGARIHDAGHPGSAVPGEEELIRAVLSGPAPPPGPSAGSTLRRTAVPTLASALLLGGLSLLAGAAAAIVGPASTTSERVAMWSLGIGLLAFTFAVWATVLSVPMPKSPPQRLAHVAALVGATAFAGFAASLVIHNLV